MPRFIIERTIPAAGELTAVDRQMIARKSCDVLRQLGPEIQWVESYVTDDRFFCVYLAPDAEVIREHARRGGFPADRILEVHAIVDPTTAEAGVGVG
jgi:hypothetical protein